MKLAAPGPVRNGSPMWWRVIDAAGSIELDFLDVNAALNLSHAMSYKSCPCRECRV